MISVLLVTSAAPPAEILLAELPNAGFHVLGAVTWRNLVRESLQRAPQLVIGHDVNLAADAVEALKALLAAQPLPVLLFTQSPDADQIDQAVGAGVSAHVVNGYAPGRLRPLAHMAMARFRHEQALREQLARLSERFEERKLVDRAKGVLMRARQVPEDEAFRMLRLASMHTNLRVGQVSQQVIDAARFAEAVNRAGQLRMLSQQLLKHAVLQLLATDPAPDGERIAALLTRGEQNLAALDKSLSKATYGDLLEAIRAPWQQLAAALRRPLVRERLAAIDGLAEQLLEQAERLTTQLEHAALAAPLRVINLSGRQRMLSQRAAKQALMAAVLSGEGAASARLDAAASAAAFAQALTELEAMPLSSREIRADLSEARRLWAAMPSLPAVARPAGQAELRATSEALLALFEQLTQRYEHSLQMLLG